MNEPEATPRATFDAETPVDGALRQALEPDPATVRRLVQQALAKDSSAPLAKIPWRLATAAALVFVVISLGLLTRSDSPPTSVPAPSNVPAASEPIALQISNEGGLVTVTTPAGSKMVLLPFIPQPGDAS